MLPVLFLHTKRAFSSTSCRSLSNAAAAMTAYPSIQAYKSEMLDVDDTHSISIRQYGNPQGVPVVHIHGGPGGACSDRDATRFSPSTYRIVLFDQRGCGESTPPSCLKDNTTQHLIEDIETIRKHLGVGESWHVFGGSWGSTLSLAYAQAHPKSVKSLTLRGIFTLRKEELDFFYQGPGTSFLFPEYWDEYVSVIPEAERGDMVKAYHNRLTGDDEEERAKAGKAWSTWEMSTSRLRVDPDYIKKADAPGFADAFARIESHYFVNEGFLPQGELLKKENIDKIRHIPTVIVQGRYDCVCPIKTSWDLHKAFPEAEYIVVPDAGHSAIEEGIEKALLEATDKFSKLQ
ncbi:BQ5605_C001g00590 [Microbotryum silenes-dioicae]|uniref:Proline iminopeptidase n=1 Tax=Microbotryum silenes-dioicae TaxID=796604 RepID=A0A2X0M3T4_9BASI|nr:BQ5605_C001g00590 [Microbotryum silenes-dioicae]